MDVAGIEEDKMKKVIIVSLFSIFMVSCVAPHIITEDNVRWYSHYPSTYHQPMYHQPTKVIIIKKNTSVHKKRHIKVRVNKKSVNRRRPK